MKTLFSALFTLMALPVLATPVTSPFYQPTAGHILSQTSAFYIKNKIKDHVSSRIYHRGLDEKVTIGLGAGLSALMQGNLNWTKQKLEATLSVPHTKGYDAGLTGLWEISGILTRLTTLYHQTTNIDFKPRRAIEANLHLGKSLKTMTPYLHLSATIPLNARPEVNDPIYRGETGVFQSVNKSITLDTALYFQYDKNIKERSYGIRAEWSYLITPQMALSLNGEWQARGHAKNHAKTYHQAVGCKISVAF